MEYVIVHMQFKSFKIAHCNYEWCALFRQVKDLVIVKEVESAGKESAGMKEKKTK